MNTYSIHINNKYIGFVRASKYMTKKSEGGKREYKIFLKDEDSITVALFSSKSEIIIKENPYDTISVYIEQ